LSERTKNHMMQ